MVDCCEAWGDEEDAAAPASPNVLVDALLVVVFCKTWESAGVATEPPAEDTSGPTTVLVPLPCSGSVAVTSTPLAFSRGDDEDPPAGPVAEEDPTEVEDPVLDGTNEMTVVWAAPVAVAPGGLTLV